MRTLNLDNPFLVSQAASSKYKGFKFRSLQGKDRLILMEGKYLRAQLDPQFNL